MIKSSELKQSVSANEEVLRQVFENCSDIVFRPIIIDSQNKILFIYIDGLIDTKVVETSCFETNDVRRSA